MMSGEVKLFTHHCCQLSWVFMNFIVSKVTRFPAPLRIIVLLLLIGLVWFPFALPLFLGISDPNQRTIVTMGFLFVVFLVMIQLWGKKVYQQENLIKYYGLVGSRQNGQEWLIGLGSGVLLTLTLFIVEGLFGWLNWEHSSELSRMILEGFLSGIGVGFAEELVFRGWLLDEFERDYHPSIALGINSLLFAILHFIKPLDVILQTWPQFPGLFLLALILILTKRICQNRLGFPMGFHGGLVWGYYLINVGNLVEYSGRAPDWITGVNGNPLAGVMGVGFLSLILFFLQSKYSKLLGQKDEQ